MKSRERDPFKAVLLTSGDLLLRGTGMISLGTIHLFQRIKGKKIEKNNETQIRAAGCVTILLGLLSLPIGMQTYNAIETRVGSFSEYIEELGEDVGDRYEDFADDVGDILEIEYSHRMGNRYD